MKRITVIFLYLIFLCLNIQAQDEIIKVIDSFKKEQELKNALAGISIKNLSTNKYIYEWNAKQMLIPASVMKVPVSIVALAELGKDFRFKTKLAYSGYINDKSELTGNLYIIGDGDPSFGTRRNGDSYSIDSIYKKWLKAIIAEGIMTINGSIIADATVFDDEPVAQSWLLSDIGNYYGAGTSGLNINENLYKVYFKPGKNIGDKAEIIRLEPEISYLQITNNVKTGKEGSGDNVCIYGKPYSKERIMEGTVPKGRDEFVVKGSMPDAAYYAAHSFLNYLENNDIKVMKPATTSRELILKNEWKKEELHIIAEHLSPSLEEIVLQTNIYSINTYAESILKKMGGTRQKGIETVLEFWKGKFDTSGFKLFDGSGLSILNRINCHQLTEMLDWSSKEEEVFKPFYNSLAIAGISGSIRNNFKGSLAENNIRAKSGYMKNVRAYCGYLTNSKSELISFAIIINFKDSQNQVKEKIEKLLIEICK